MLEYLAISYRFDAGLISQRNDWLAALSWLGNLGPLSIVIATATLVLGRTRIREWLVAARAAAGTQRPTSRLEVAWKLGLHATCFLAFFALTRWLVEGTAPGAPPPAPLLAVAWAGLGLGVPLTLAYPLLPSRVQPRVLARPIPVLGFGLILGSIGWIAGRGSEQLWDPLGPATLAAVAGLLGGLGATVRADPAEAVLGLEDFEVIVSPVCSGYEGMGLISILTAGYLWWFREGLRFPRALLLVPIGILAAWVANVGRIAALMAVGAWWSADVALSGFHTRAGWLLFCGIALGLVAATEHSMVFRKPLAKGRTEAGTSKNPTSAYLTPLLAMVAVGMVTGLLSTDFDFLYPLAALTGAGVLWHHRRSYPRPRAPIWSGTAVALGLATFVLWILLEPDADEAAVSRWLEELLSLGPWLAALWVGLHVVGSVLVVPIVEEVAFRGYLLRRLISREFTRVPFGRFAPGSFLVSSVAFGLLHQRWVAGCLAGMLFAAAQYRRGRLSDAVVAHGVANLLIAIYAIALGRWSLWM